MTIWVNHNEHQYDASITLFELLELLNKSDKTGIAIAVNNNVIPKKSWRSFKIKNQDKITIITATQGG
jgi:sulfur carrier protein